MYKNLSKVDVIIPNFNKGKYLDQAIKSVLKQNFKNWILYIIDDNSTDDSKEILNNYKKIKKIKFFFLNKNKGPGFCRNYGITKSKSPYIAFLDSDDIWKKDKLKTQINFMKKKNYLFSYTDYETFTDKNGKKIFLGKTNLVNSLNFFQFIQNSSINTSTMIIDRKIINKVKFKNLKKLEDYIFKCEILKKNKKLSAYKLPKSTAFYRILSNARSNSKLKNISYLWNYNKRFNKLNFIDNCKSLIMISFNSLKKYGFK